MRAFVGVLATVSLVISAHSASPAADDKKLTPQQRTRSSRARSRATSPSSKLPSSSW